MLDRLANDITSLPSFADYLNYNNNRNMENTGCDTTEQLASNSNSNCESSFMLYKIVNMQIEIDNLKKYIKTTENDKSDDDVSSINDNSSTTTDENIKLEINEKHSSTEEEIKTIQYDGKLACNSE